MDWYERIHFCLSEGISLQDFWERITTEFIYGLIERNNRAVERQAREMEKWQQKRR